MLLRNQRIMLVDELGDANYPVGDFIRLCKYAPILMEAHDESVPGRVLPSIPVGAILEAQGEPVDGWILCDISIWPEYAERFRAGDEYILQIVGWQYGETKSEGSIAIMVEPYMQEESK